VAEGAPGEAVGGGDDHRRAGVAAHADLRQERDFAEQDGFQFLGNDGAATAQGVQSIRALFPSLLKQLPS